MCVPTGNHSRDLVSYEEFVSFFEQIREYAEHITLIGGETFMYPWILEVLELLGKEKVAVTINTNATMLSDRIVPRLLNLHELHLKCSIDAATPQTYYRIRGTDVFERVTTNIRNFSRLVREKPAIHLILVYVVMKENLQEVLPFIDFAKTVRPFRVIFNPVRHVTNWHVTNDTSWTFDGKEQSCEYFRDEYNDVMTRAMQKCKKEGLEYAIQLL
jgi:sulfatase maturation enzyme AslB (radical SAM superfamily)